MEAHTTVRLEPRGLWHAVALFLLAVQIVARWITPTDGAVEGETLWIAQLALLSLIAWSLAAYRAGILFLRFRLLDAAVALLVSGQIIAALVVLCTQGDKRATLNLLWEWIGVAATFFLLRQTMISSADRRRLLLVFAAVAVSLSALGLWQHFAEFAETRREYDALVERLHRLQNQSPSFNPQTAAEQQAALRKIQAEFVRMGVPAEEGPRKLWEQRLRSSTEPFALFALANTLAGLLAPALILWLFTLLWPASTPLWPVSHRATSPDRRSPSWLLCTVYCVLCTGCLAYCLLLTKSRTAYVGLLAGVALGAFTLLQSRSARPRRLLRWAAAALVILAALAGVAFATGGLDRLVLSESGKSLRYRLEYWTGAWGVLTDSPRTFLLGVGPGNFRDHYLRHKLPGSSEEIADPHNLLLDVWANGGLISLAGLLGLSVVGLRFFRSADPSPDLLQQPALSPRSSPQEIPRAFPPQRVPESDLLESLDVRPFWTSPLILGAAAAFILVFLLGGATDDRPLLALLGTLITMAVCRSLWTSRDLPAAACFAAAFALAVHLLGAGGIAMPAILLTLLVLLTLADVPSLPPLSDRKSPLNESCVLSTSSRTPPILAGTLALLLYFACWFTATSPVLNARVLLAAGNDALLEHRNPAKAEALFRQAAVADPFSAEPEHRLAQLSLQAWLADREATTEQFQRVSSLHESVIAKDPYAFGGYRALGEAWLLKFDRSHDTADAARAAEAFSQAVDRYPNQAALQSQLAEALWRSSDSDSVGLAARRALELNELNRSAGHTDKILPESRVNLLNRILSPP